MSIKTKRRKKKEEKIAVAAVVAVPSMKETKKVETTTTTRRATKSPPDKEEKQVQVEEKKEKKKKSFALQMVFSPYGVITTTRTQACRRLFWDSDRKCELVRSTATTVSSTVRSVGRRSKQKKQQQQQLPSPTCGLTSSRDELMQLLQTQFDQRERTKIVISNSSSSGPKTMAEEDLDFNETDEWWLAFYEHSTT